jgi:translation initiation factor RLI1
LLFAADAEFDAGELDVVDGMISAGGVGVVYGGWSVGKTFFATYLAYSVACLPDVISLAACS